MTDELTEDYGQAMYRKGHDAGEALGGITALNTLISAHMANSETVHIDELIKLRNKLIDRKNSK